MRINETFRIAVAEYTFSGVSFEDVLHSDVSLKPKSLNILDGKEVWVLPLVRDRKILEDNQDKIQDILDALAVEFVKERNQVLADVKFQRIELESLNRPHSAVLRYDKRGKDFVPHQILIWYIVEFLDFQSFFLKEAEKKFPFKEA